MSKFEIRTIPGHIAYMAEYDIDSYYEFFDFETGDNQLQDLEDLMHSENPDVTVPEMPDDYNYFTHPMATIPEGKMHIKYYDMVEKSGVDNPDGKYRFVEVPEVKAAVIEHHGAFSKIANSIREIFELINEEGFTVSGDTRVSAIHGPWDRDSEEDYLMEIEVPIK